MNNDTLAPNISVSANIWADVSHPERDPGRYAPLDVIPGDLRVNLLETRDTQILQQILTTKQHREFLYCRFFAPHGQTGVTYER